MVDAADLKTGVSFLLDGKPFQVQKYEHIKIGRGGAKIRVSLRNLKTGELAEQTFNNNGGKFEEISTNKKRMQFLYSDPDNVTFMDMATYEQVEIPRDILKDQIMYLNEGEEVNVLFWEGVALLVEVPPNVVLEVAETDPGVKGNSASNVYKSAKLVNGLEVKVPLFIKNGEKIRVDTRSGEYLERANS